MNDPQSMREILFKGWLGCSNRDCIVTGIQKGIGTTEMCKCVVDASRTQLHILQFRLIAAIEAQGGHNE